MVYVPYKGTIDEPCSVDGCEGKQYGQSGKCFVHLLEETRINFEAKYKGAHSDELWPEWGDDEFE